MEFIKKNTTKIIIVLVITALVFALFKLINRGSSSANSQELKKPSATSEVNKEMSFPLRNEEKEEIGKFKYTLTSAEKREEILVQGQKAKAISGRKFLILNLKIVNEFNQSIELNTRDFVRLSVNGNKDEWLAPDIHNDPVEVQAMSTKNTRIGFPISDDDKDFVIRMGEINGEKQEFNLEF